MARRNEPNYVIIKKKASDIETKKNFIECLNTVQSRTNIFPMNNNHQFWSYDAYLSDLLIHGYIRMIKLKCHPTDIINITFLYYQPLIPSFTIHSVLSHVTNLYRAEWMQEEIKMHRNTSMTVKKSMRNVIEPCSDNKWCERPNITINNITYPLQYTFSIKLIKNMLNNNNVHIGITSNVSKKKYQTAYFMTSVKHTNDDKNIFKFKKYCNWRQKDQYAFNDAYGKLLNMVLLPTSTSDDNAEITLILNCNIWRLYFLFNGYILNAVNVEKNKCYIPLIVTNKCEMDMIEYQVVKMKCNVNIIKQKKIYSKTEDIDKYIFVYGNDGGYFGGWIETINAVSTSNDVFNLLWNGYKLIYFDGSNNLYKLMKGMISGYLSTKIAIILEIYRFFWNEYMKYIQYILLNKEIFHNKYSHKIALIITDFVIKNYNKEYKIHKKNDTWIGSLIQPKMYKGFNLWFAMRGYCPTCYDFDIDNWYFEKTVGFVDQFENNKDLFNIMKTERYISYHNNLEYRSYNGEKRRWKTNKVKKRKGYKTRKNDKKGNHESIKQFKKRYQLSLQY